MPFNGDQRLLKESSQRLVERQGTDPDYVKLRKQFGSSIPPWVKPVWRRYRQE